MKDQTRPQKRKRALETSEASSPSSKRKATPHLVLNAPKSQQTSPQIAPSPLALPTPSTASFASSPRTPKTPQRSTQAIATPTSKLSARKLRTINDPLNISIYDLRKQGLDWEEIATKTNAKCNTTGTDAELTGMACYSRFFRNGPLIARERGEGFEKQWYLHMRGPVGQAEAAGDDGDSSGDETELDEVGIEAVVVSVIEKARAEFWEMVTAEVNEHLGEAVMTVGEVMAIDERLRDEA